MARRSALRASDEDRDRVAEHLRNAAGEGRLLTEELEDRLGAAFSSRTYGELDAVVSDLPVPRDERRHKTPLWAKATLALAILLMMMAVLAVVAVVVVGVASAWLLWVVFAWMCFGRGRRVRRLGHSRARRHPLGYGSPRTRAPRGGPASL
jgi:fatty acid desaturase